MFQSLFISVGLVYIHHDVVVWSCAVIVQFMLVINAAHVVVPWRYVFMSKWTNWVCWVPVHRLIFIMYCNSLCYVLRMLALSSCYILLFVVSTFVIVSHVFLGVLYTYAMFRMVSKSVQFIIGVQLVLLVVSSVHHRDVCAVNVVVVSMVSNQCHFSTTNICDCVLLSGFVSALLPSVHVQCCPMTGLCVTLACCVCVSHSCVVVTFSVGHFRTPFVTDRACSLIQVRVPRGNLLCACGVHKLQSRVADIPFRPWLCSYVFVEWHSSPCSDVLLCLR